MKHLILLLFTISSFSQVEQKIDTLTLGETSFLVQKIIEKTSEIQYYYQVDNSENIINEYQVEIYHDPLPYSSFFFKPVHAKGSFFPVTSLKNSDIKKRNVKKDSTYVLNTINKLLLDETMADDLVFEQEMKINGTVPNCLSDIENYAIGRMGGKEFIVRGKFPTYGVHIESRPLNNSGGLLIKVNNKCKIVNVSNTNGRFRSKNHDKN